MKKEQVNYEWRIDCLSDVDLMYEYLIFLNKTSHLSNNISIQFKNNIKQRQWN